MADEYDDGSDDDNEEQPERLTGLVIPPDRGRVIIVNFDMGGRAVGKEFGKSGRPCVVVQNNKMRRGRLVTVVPLSGKEPPAVMPYHHLMDHRSFVHLPMWYGGQGKPRWAKCDYLTTVSLDRCLDPYRRPPNSGRQYIRVKVIKADMEAIERCVLWGLGIDLRQPAP